MTDSSLQIAQRLRLTVDRLRRVIRHGRAVETTPRGHEVALSWLHRRGPMSIADLARLEEVRPQSMGVIINDMAAAGLVDRTPDPSDGRRELVTPTDAGRTLYRTVAETRDRDLALLFDTQLSAAERATVDEAIRILERILPAGS